MSDLMETVATLKIARTMAMETIKPISILINKNIEIHVYGLEGLNQIPGEVEVASREYCDEYPIRAEKVVDGVTFFCLLRSEEALTFSLTNSLILDDVMASEITQ